MVTRFPTPGKDKRTRTFYNYLYLKPREQAYIQFISTDVSDGSDMFLCLVHHTKQVVDGKERFPIYLCFPKSADPNQISKNDFLNKYEESQKPCQFCESPEENDRRVSIKFYYWVYTHEIWHKNQNPRLINDPNATLWTKKLNKANEEFYMETIDKPMVLEQGPTFNNTLFTCSMNYDTLENKVFMYSRGIAYGRSQHNLVPADNFKQVLDSDQISTLKEVLPPLHTIVVSRISPKNLPSSSPPTQQSFDYSASKGESKDALTKYLDGEVGESNENTM